VVKEVLSHSPNDQAGGSAGRPVRGRVLLEDLLGTRAVDDEVLEAVPLDAELDARDGLRGNLERNQAGMVDEDAVPVVGQVERNVLVCLLAARPAVFVPDVDRLSVLDEWSEPLAEPVHALAHAEAELIEHVVVAVGLDDAHALGLARGENATAGLEVDSPFVVPADPNRQPARGQLGGGVGRPTP
jgi:hypothetical protein